jgi:hypothetical protein
LKLNNKIKFYPINSEVAELIESPTPSSKYNIPDWFRKLPKYTNGESKFIYNHEPNLTVKSCLPVVDAFTSGYTINLHCDIQVTQKDGRTIFQWAYEQYGVPGPVRPRDTIVSSQKCGWNNIEGYEDLNFDWVPSWSIKTPKGYSSMFTHPINRVDLPFYTLGGVLDTDGWGDAGNHPFLLKKGWEGIIEKGTPIIQVIPFRRENWLSDVDKSMTKEYDKQIGRRDSYLKDYYKKFIWSSKSYK